MKVHQACFASIVALIGSALSVEQENVCTPSRTGVIEAGQTLIARGSVGLDLQDVLGGALDVFSDLASMGLAKEQFDPTGKIPCHCGESSGVDIHPRCESLRAAKFF